MSKTSVVWIFYDSLSKTQSNPISTEEAQMAILKMRPQDTLRFFIWTVGWEKWQPLKAYLDSKQSFFVSSFNRFNETIDISHQDTVKTHIRDVLQMQPVTQQTIDEITQSGYDPDAITHTQSGVEVKSFSEINLNEEPLDQLDKNIGLSQFEADDLQIDNIKKPKLNFKKFNKRSKLDRRADRLEIKIEILLISAKGKTFRSKSKNISLSGALVEDSIPFDYCGVTFDAVVINNCPSEPKYQRVSLKAKTVGEGLTQRIYYVDTTDQQKNSLQKLLENYLEHQKTLKTKS